MIKFAIVINVFKRKDNKSFFLVKRALNSILDQTYKNFKIYLIGDKYEDEIEFQKIVNLVPKDKIYSVNLDKAVEREKYSYYELWNVGGTNAANLALNKIDEDELEWICFLDYDDFYFPNHLEVINDAIQKTKANFISTIALIEKDSENERFLPCSISENLTYFNNYLPESCNIAKTSICINHIYFNNIKFKNMIEEENKIYPGDADLFDRLKEFLINKNEYGILVNVHTCSNSIGGSIMHENII